MLQIDQKKYQRQEQAQQRWQQAARQGLSPRDGWGTICHATGVGKTFTACDIIRKMLVKDTSRTFIIVVPGPEIFKQWKDEIARIIPEEHHKMIDVYTIHKVMEDFKNGIIRSCCLLITDEAHEYYSDERIKIFFGAIIQSDYLLALTANFEDVIHHKHTLVQGIIPVVDRITLEEAEKEGYVSKFIEYNLGVDFTPEEKKIYDEITDKMTKNLSKLGKNGLETANKILQGASKKEYGIVYAIASNNGWRKDLDLSYDAHRQINDLWHPSKIIGYASNGINAIRERKVIIYNAVNKMRTAVDVITKFDKLKTICFSQTTVFADTLGKRVNDYYLQKDPHSKPVCVVYHSALKTIITPDNKKKGKTVLKREAIEAIRSGEARVISSASSLDRGVSIDDLEMALTTSGTQNPNQYNQRRGRGIRVLQGKDKIALIVNVYVRNSQDERWLKKRQSKNTNTIYYISTVDEISYSPKDKETFNLQEV